MNAVRCRSARTGEPVNCWVLAGARAALGPHKSERLDLEIRSGKIVRMHPSGERCNNSFHCLDLRGCLVLPGLINAHDHLEFNLFPNLGHGPYPNAGAWARDIYRPDRPPLCEHLRVPLAARLRWGAIKNLLSGVTTVCHHNPRHPAFSRGFPVRVPGRFGWAHSLEFSPDFEQRFRRTPPGRPFILHLGEAVDRGGAEEIFRLDAAGALDERTVLVHAVALDVRGLRLARERGASLVWCPSSNHFILGKTLQLPALECGISVALGTDSALSGIGDMLDEIRFAQRAAGLSAARLYEMVTLEAARVMKLKQGEGRLEEGGSADVLVVRDRGRTPAETVLELSSGEMEMVMVKGEFKLVSRACFRRLPADVSRFLHPLMLKVREERQLYVAAGMAGLFSRVEPILGTVTLAGKSVRRAA